MNGRRTVLDCLAKLVQCLCKIVECTSGKHTCACQSFDWCSYLKKKCKLEVSHFRKVDCYLSELLTIFPAAK